jgi:hypothetical protein
MVFNKLVVKKKVLNRSSSMQNQSVNIMILSKTRREGYWRLSNFRILRSIVRFLPLWKTVSLLEARKYITWRRDLLCILHCYWHHLFGNIQFVFHWLCRKESWTARKPNFIYIAKSHKGKELHCSRRISIKRRKFCWSLEIFSATERSFFFFS